MITNSPLEMQRAVLVTLFDRATKGHWTDASLSRPRISELLTETTGIRLNPAVLQIYLDGLVENELVSMPQRGVRDRWQITAKGIQHVDASSLDTVSAESWTGHLSRTDITEEDQNRIVARIKQLRVVIEKAHLSNTERSQAEALVTAAICIAEAPQPPWELVKQMLILISSISTVLTFAIEIAKLIK